MNNILTFSQHTLMSSSVGTKPVTPKPITPESRAEEQVWAQAAQEGDRAAFMQIVDAYQRPVYNLCYRMLGDPTEAEDAAQETFLRAYTKLDTYNPKRKLSSWLLSIASHYCIDQLRKQRYQMLSWDDLPPWQAVADKQPQPEEAALKQESRDTVRTLLNTLPPDYRAATVLRYWHDMSYNDIAQTLDTSVSAIKSRLFRARQMLADAADQADAAG